MIKLQKVDEYKHRDGSVSQDLPHGHVWIRPENIVLIEELVKGPTQITVAIPTGGYSAYTSYRVAETPEQVLSAIDVHSAHA